MSFVLNDWLKETIDIRIVNGFDKKHFYQDVRPRIVCNDGFSISVQASSFTYCHPRYTQYCASEDVWLIEDGNEGTVFVSNDYIPYDEVECGFPSEEDETLINYIETINDDPTKAVYPYTPIDIVEKLIEKHGGFKECSVK